MTRERIYGQHIRSGRVYYKVKHTIPAVMVRMFKLGLTHLTGMYLLAVVAVETLQACCCCQEVLVDGKIKYHVTI